MAKRKSKAGTSLRQTKPTPEQQQALKVPLAQLEDQLYKLLASYRFYDYAVLHLAQPDNEENTEAECFAFGVWLYQQQLKQQGDNLMDKLNNIQKMIH